MSFLLSGWDALYQTPYNFSIQENIKKVVENLNNYVTILLQVINKMLKVQERQNDAIRSSVHTQINQKFSQG